jgi:hypothetical protein
MRDHRENDGYSGPEPQDTNQYLSQRHGCGFMGFQFYRIVHSQYVTALSGGEWSDWDKNLPTALRGSLVADQTGKGVTPNCRAERQVVEMRQVPKYPILFHAPGWIFERWMAPAYFGSPVEWEQRVVPGTSIPKLGPYPFKGEYILIGGPYPEAPTGPFLDRLVEQWELMRDETLAMEAGAYVRMRTYEAEQEDAQASEKWNREASAANMVAMSPLFSTFLDGGRARQIAAEKAGIFSNYGN